MKQLRKSSGLNNLYYAGAILLGILITGVIGYRIIEGFSLLDSLFMVVNTIATVGFSQTRPLSDVGKSFTIILILSSFGIFAYVISTMTQFLIDGGFKNYYC
ncbi:MAG: potassium channel family protein [Bacteroidales bacterium]|jgi:voltage-gated potassium channel